MAIYDIFNVEKEEASQCEVSLDPPKPEAIPSEGKPTPSEPDSSSCLDIQGRGRFFSSVAARLFFFLLLIADLFWAVYAVALFLLGSVLHLLTGNRSERFHQLKGHAWISLRRSLVCGVSLFVALFSPSFGIMIACTYFLMYDKSGIEEVVPSSLQSQFKEFLPKG